MDRRRPMKKLFLAASAALLMWAVPTGSAAAAAASQRPAVTAVHFTGTFLPQQLVAVDGSVWALGSVGSNSSGRCELDHIGGIGATLSQRFTPIPSCAVDVTAGNGMIYLLAQQGEAASNIRQMHVESFDPRTGVATVMAPVVMGIVGSAIAHTDFTYGEGSLWLYAEDQAVGGPTVVRISPLTGQPVAPLTSVPAIGGLFPSVVADADGAWFAGGPAGSPDLVELPSGSSATRTTYSGPTNSAIIWLSAVRGEVWAEIADYGSGSKPSDLTHLQAFGGRATHAVGPDRDAGFFPLVTTSDGRLWTLSFPRQCAAGNAELDRVDPVTAAVSGVARLAVAPAVCDDGADSESSTVAVGHGVFALIPAAELGESILYRVRT
jgi:hypothetical protein